MIRESNLFDISYRWAPDRKLALIGWEQAQADGKDADATAHAAA